LPFVVKEEGGAIRFDVKVVTRSSRERIGPLIGDRLKVQITAPPVDGAANEALRTVLGKALGVAKSAVTIVRGETGREKTIEVRGADRATLLALIQD
jgi:hypothetical protein